MLFVAVPVLEFFCFFGFFFFSPGVGSQGIHLEALQQPFLVKDRFQGRSLELFAWAGFELQSS
jgi:hypothetical protein